MRVLHVSDCYLPRLGGIETQVHALAGRQRAAGLDARVITATPRRRHDVAGDDVVDGVPVHRAIVDLPFELPVHPRGGREVSRAIGRAAASGLAVDVAHVHVGVVSPFAYQALPVLTRAGLPVVVTVHSIWPSAAPLLPLLSRWRPPRPGVVLSAVSSAAALSLRAVAGAADAPILVIPNGIDANDWTVDRLPRADDEVVIAAVQRLAQRKRCLPLLEVLARAREQVPHEVRLRAVVVGEGPLRARMQRRIRRPDLSGWVRLPGRWDAAQIRDLYRRADLFVSTSTKESFGIAALEARTAGVPVLARTGTGIAGFVEDGAHGLLADDDAGLARALSGLAADPGRRRAMAARCRAEPPPMTWPAVLAACERAYAVARSGGHGA